MLAWHDLINPQMGQYWDSTVYHNFCVLNLYYMPITNIKAIHKSNPLAHWPHKYNTDKTMMMDIT